MRKLTAGLLIFLAGWGLARYTSVYWDSPPGPGARSVDHLPSSRNGPDASAGMPAAASGQAGTLPALLQRNDFEAVMAHLESLQREAGEAAVDEARTRVLGHARLLVGDGHYSLAEQLLQHFLVAAYRDVEARMLLAEALRGQQDPVAAIEQLYEARGYAYRAEMLARINGRIRTLAAELGQRLEQNEDRNALLALYQRLVQLEPDYAPWFLELAAVQTALDDRQAARSTLLLVSQDPDVGARAQAMLAELSVALAGMQESEPWDSALPHGIPLHRSGNHFVVDARPGDSRNIRLLIDTGASLTIVTPAVLEQRGIRYRDTGRTADFNTANGTVRAPVYELDTLAVGDWQVSQLEIAVLDLAGTAGVDGLLGMNFLERFRFFIDQNQARLRLSAE